MVFPLNTSSSHEKGAKLVREDSRGYNLCTYECRLVHTRGGSETNYLTLPSSRCGIQSGHPRFSDSKYLIFVVRKLRNEVNIEAISPPLGAALWIEGGEPLSDGIFGELGDGVNVQFLHDLPAMGFHRLDTHVEVRGDFLGGPAFGKKLQHLSLSRR